VRVFDSRRGHLGDRAEELAAAVEGRDKTSDRLIDSEAGKRLIVAGPGTGKTYNFHRALEAVGPGGLALTFIRALYWELERDLGGVAQVNTLHGYCKHLAYRLPLEGLSREGLDYYPALVLVMADDLTLLGRGEVTSAELQSAVNNLDDSHGLVTAVLELGSYYNAIAHCDVVYWVLTHLEANPDSVPNLPLVVIDEYQDFCLLETRMVEMLGTASPLLVAGDDDQALYGFKDASPPSELLRSIRRLSDSTSPIARDAQRSS
jgi:superfamily I DNA/RNA helicase